MGVTHGQSSLKVRQREVDPFLISLHISCLFDQFLYV